METKTQQKCKVLFNKREREGVILEERMGKIKVRVNDPGTSKNTDWFEKREVKRIW